MRRLKRWLRKLLGFYSPSEAFLDAWNKGWAEGVKELEAEGNFVFSKQREG
jgi:hypothetical protein